MWWTWNYLTATKSSMPFARCPCSTPTPTLTIVTARHVVQKVCERSGSLKICFCRVRRTSIRFIYIVPEATTLTRAVAMLFYESHFHHKL
ncbi:hypothetical protein K458DRAFT_24135 [Lentithecium fluviatile CBS 122367]|uniref:Uncharacterized protein n=1 Tax=Lentithecium fluviatile CBS 122367 TaxID=1168545 RepID=A0A6G1J5K6_9PLEO|nr:hypothetical protein K458DRAFT_24135 [Lentithecium fluviatile CBS 122367]